MWWQSASDFWAMGGYGPYVWGSLGVTAGLILLEVLSARRAHRARLAGPPPEATEAPVSARGEYV